MSTPTRHRLRPQRPAQLEQLRLTRFKSFQGDAIPFQELTVLIGRNASGKSNALDGLVALSRLASGEDLREALDGSHSDGEPIRGGAAGCAPYGTDHFTLGCRVRAGEQVIDFDITIRVARELQVVAESLRCVEGVRYANRDLANRDLLVTDAPRPDRMDITGRYFNGKRGVDPGVFFAANRPLLTQVGARIPQDTEAGRIVHRSASIVRAALREVFVLDPVPHLMRRYVNRNDVDLRRNAENLSAAVAALRDDSPDAFERLEGILRDMPERPFSRISTTETDLGDILISLDEPRTRGRPARIPAHQMSDGMLRFLAMGTALLSAPLPGRPTRNDPADPASGQRLLVIEEIENGFHPTMAAQVVALVKTESERRSIRTVVTTHSPPLLDALDGDDHAGVIVFDRDDKGLSRARPLVELPGYPELMAAGRLGTAIVGGGLAAAANERPPRSDAFRRLLVGA